MREFGTRGMQNDASDMLCRLMSRGDFEQALQFFIEHRTEIPPARRRFFFTCIGDGLSGHKSYRRVVKTAAIMLVVNLLIQPLFSLQLLDLFAFLSRMFLYYNYFAELLPQVLNVLFALSLIYQWYKWVILPGRLFGSRVKPVYGAAFIALLAVVLSYTAVQTIPVAMDFPMVRDGGYLTRVITEADDVAMIYGQIIRTTDREDVADALRRELHEKYGWDYDAENYPIPYYKTGKRLGRDTALIYLDAEGEYYEMSGLRYNATMYSDTQYPIVIMYLRNSKTILQIVNG